MSCVSHHVTLQHLLRLVPPLSPRVGPHVDVVGVEVLPVEKLFYWTAEETGEPTDLTQVTHVPHGGGRGGDQQQRQQQGRHRTVSGR